MILKTNNLRFSYDNQESFNYPDLEISPGEHTLILGESGCGKTTLLHLLTGLLQAESGAVYLEGEDLEQLPPRQLDKLRGKKIGMVFQQAHFISSLNVQENLNLALRLSGNSEDSGLVSKYLESVGLIGKELKRISELSVGEQQRVAIIRALIHGPKIIFADEPTAALDDTNTKRVCELLLSRAEEAGATLIVVTHDQRLKKYISNQIVL